MKKAIIVLAAVGLTSCNKTWFENMSYKEYERTRKRDVVVYTDGRPVPKDAVEIGIINYKASNLRKALRRSRREGAIHGANAIYAIKPAKDRAFIGARGQFKAVYIKPTN